MYIILTLTGQVLYLNHITQFKLLSETIVLSNISVEVRQTETDKLSKAALTQSLSISAMPIVPAIASIVTIITAYGLETGLKSSQVKHMMSCNTAYMILFFISISFY